MIIDIAKRKFNTALNLAEHSRYFDALAIFTSYPDDYEAQLNRIGCLSAMGEPIAAVRVLRTVLYAGRIIFPLLASSSIR